MNFNKYIKHLCLLPCGSPNIRENDKANNKNGQWGYDTYSAAASILSCHIISCDDGCSYYLLLLLEWYGWWCHHWLAIGRLSVSTRWRLLISWLLSIVELSVLLSNACELWWWCARSSRLIWSCSWKMRLGTKECCIILLIWGSLRWCTVHHAWHSLRLTLNGCTLSHWRSCIRLLWCHELLLSFRRLRIFVIISTLRCFRILIKELLLL